MYPSVRVFPLSERIPLGYGLGPAPRPEDRDVSPLTTIILVKYFPF